MGSHRVGHFLPPPRAGTCSWPSSKGSFSPNTAPPHSCILNFTLWIPPLPGPQVLESSCPGPSAVPPMAPCPAPTLVRLLWALTKFSSITGPMVPESPPPSPRASLLFCLSLNPRRGVTPGPCSPLAPQSQALTTSSLQSLPFPHSRNTCPWSTVHLLSLHHPLFGSTTPVDSHYLNLVSEILVYATWSAGFSYRESSPRPPPPACWLPDPNPLWRCDLTPSNPSHHVGASQCAPWLSLLLPLRYFNSP